jgi:hypothetical protein
VADRKRILERLGLEGYGAKAYLALLETGPATAKGVAERANIPKGRIYEVLEELHRRGQVELLPEMPKRYRAVPLLDLYDRLLRRQGDELEVLRAERNMVAEAFAASPKPTPLDAAGEAVVLRDHDLILDRSLESIDRARRDVLVLGSPEFHLRLPLWEDAVRASLGKGVRWRVLAAAPDAGKAVLEALRAWGAVFDDDRLLVLRGPAHPRLRGDPVAYVWDEPAVAAAMRDGLEAAWGLDPGKASPSTWTPSPEARGRSGSAPGASPAPRVPVAAPGKRAGREGPRSK